MPSLDKSNSAVKCDFDEKDDCAQKTFSHNVDLYLL